MVKLSKLLNYKHQNYKNFKDNANYNKILKPHLNNITRTWVIKKKSMKYTYQLKENEQKVCRNERVKLSKRIKNYDGKSEWVLLESVM